MLCSQHNTITKTNNGIIFHCLLKYSQSYCLLCNRVRDVCHSKNPTANISIRWRGIKVDLSIPRRSAFNNFVRYWRCCSGRLETTLILPNALTPPFGSCVLVACSLQPSCLSRPSRLKSWHCRCGRCYGVQHIWQFLQSSGLLWLCHTNAEILPSWRWIEG